MRGRVALLVVGFVVLIGSVPAKDPDPTDVYKREKVEGFSVLFHPAVHKQTAVATEVRKELTTQLKFIGKAVPPATVGKLKEFTIWVEKERDGGGSAIYHPSADWLTEHKLNPDKAGGVELSNWRNFVQWSRNDQPCLLLHALAQGYHHKVVGLTDEDVMDAFQQAMDKKLYDAVPRGRGPKGKAQAAASERAYFAELTEAYFGKNDYFPYTKADLERHDPQGFQMIEKAWDVEAKPGGKKK